MLRTFSSAGSGGGAGAAAGAEATGAGAAARRSMGTGVFGGMLAATFIATIFIPMFFSWLSDKRKSRSTHPDQVEEKKHESP